MADSEQNGVLTARQYNAIAYLLTEPTLRQAAEAAKIPERTLSRWLKNPAFAAEYRAARRECVQQTFARSQQGSGAMLNVLFRLAANARSEAVKLSAASKALDIAIRSVEIDDLLARVEALEEANAAKL